MRVGIIDIDLGNVGSVANIFRRIGATPTITSDRSELESSDLLVLSGVGKFDEGMSRLNDIVPFLTEQVTTGRPFLGICLGMQMLTDSSEEGSLPGLGWIPARTVRFAFDDPGVKIPHMGWNSVQPCADASNLFPRIDDDLRFYFVHSYHVQTDTEHTMTTTHYGGQEFTSAIWRENIVGLQFHPEKSHVFGMGFLKQYLESIR